MSISNTGFTMESVDSLGYTPVDSVTNQIYLRFFVD